MVKHGSRIVALGTLGAMTMTALGGVAMTPAHAVSTKTKRNIAIGAGAVTAYGLLKGKKKTAIVGGVATAGSYLWYRNSKKKEEARRQAWYQQRYGRNWRNHYKSGA
jgi:hypothetical protein